ncbi:hypothetical protein LSTR_LSTR009621 [Laodelphax striatellus]|uniref:SAP domain-containing protein n=1 Tax=Laodelphax striatellus TaxID=195883 RepID=A0A482WN97_LAOST|nr:hypothetical protein LSTR_LSTR009621 [Laodelphax striatellus]
MSQFGSSGVKNPPWARQGQQLGQNTNPNMQQQAGQMQQPAMAGQAPLLQYPPQQIFQQNQLQQNVFNQMGAISYPTRQQLNTAAFSPAATIAAAASRQQQLIPPSHPHHQPPPPHPQSAALAASNQQQQQQQMTSASNAQKQRVFTGVITKLMPEFGFVDDDVFFLLNVVKGPEVAVGDRVLVTAVFNAYMQHKWNAVCIELLDRNRQFGNYNAVPPPIDNSSNSSSDFGRRQRRREEARSRRDDDNEIDRKKRREERREREEKEKEKEKERARSPTTSIRKRSKSPRRRPRLRVPPRYMVYIPQISLDIREANVMELKKRYSSMYVPSDFFTSLIPRVDVFPAQRSLTLDRPCSFHLMHKDVEPVSPQLPASQQDPPDADYLFSAKVMLLSMPPLAEIFKRSCSLAEDSDEAGGSSGSSSSSSEFVHVTRLIQLLVGVRGKNENMAIGGPWSPSLDGADPARDPSVLIKTAIRNCRALTGIDLSNCTQWFRFLEIYYRRAESVHKGKTVAARVETVVIFVPDIWSCQPTQLEWDALSAAYRQALARKLHADAAADAAADISDDDDEQLVAEADSEDVVIAAAAPADEKEATETDGEAKKEPTHHSLLDVKTMKVTEMRDELEARGLSLKGIKSLLSARLNKALKSEQEKAEADSKSESKPETPTPKTPPHSTDKEEKSEKKKKKEEGGDKKKIDDKERAMLEKRYTLPDSPRVIVHPSKTAKSGKFDCSVMSLSVLLDYREADTKEHFFEVSLFAELFNEMLMRDFAFRIYRALVDAPEKPKEEKEEKDDDRKDRKEKKDKKKKDKVKMVTEDPHLLLAFVYFDQTQCGYILDKDLEAMLLTLDLNLSRSQIKKLIQKVVTGTALNYRTLTDKPKVEEKDGDSEKDSKTNGEKKNIDVESAAAGNKSLLPVFRFDADSSDSAGKTTSNDDTNSSDTQSSTGKILYKGAFLDIEQLMSQLSRSETARTETEKHLSKLRSDFSSLKEYSNKCEVNLKDIKAELKGVREKLSNNETGFSKIEARANQYLETLVEINKKILPFIQKDEVTDKSSKSSTKESSEICKKTIKTEET